MSKKKNEIKRAPSSIDVDLDAVRRIIAILDIFNDADQERILRWVKEKIGMNVGPY